MGNEAVKLYSDVNTYLDKPIVEKKDSTSNVSLFENEQQVIAQDEHDLISETEEKIAKLEEDLAKIKDDYENGTVKKALTGGLFATFASTYLLGTTFDKESSISDMPRLLLKLEKISRKIKKPVMNNLFAAGVSLAGFAVVAGLSALMFVMVGKNNDKAQISVIEQKLAEEKAKLATLQQEMAVE